LSLNEGRVWVSGGIQLPDNLQWSPSKKHDPSLGVLQTTLPKDFPLNGFSGLFTGEKHERLTRARFPNSDVENDQWGYASPSRDLYSISINGVNEWKKPGFKGIPKFEYTDLRSKNPSGAMKNDSTMNNYNTWGSGSGGACATVWGEGLSYWCGNNSDGGWAEVDQECAKKGELQIPVGLEFEKDFLHDTSNITLGERWKNADLTGGIVHAWHSQSWAVHMFRIESYDASKYTMNFTVGSGGQGGRNWCRCDQCGYAARTWCADHAPEKGDNTLLIGGSWYIENVLEELDSPNEWYLERETRTLYFKPNTSDNKVENLVSTILSTLIEIEGTEKEPAANISLKHLGFRDSEATYMKENAWGVPSGGDWSLYKGGAVYLKQYAESIDIIGCHFHKLDGNAVFLGGRTRGIRILANEFSFLGENAVASWGDTKLYDATNGLQPRNTEFGFNYVHDIGIYEKQSSAWFQAKSCLSNVHHNIIFNLPRAGINLNDHMCGGDKINSNLIWNTCRESGDHGPINSWDRMPFLTTVRYGYPSFEPLPMEISKNVIISNYGASQGIDNDDGSSFFNIHDNVFYASDGFKMDYGGHDSNFYNNLVLVMPYDGQNCYNVGDFFSGHQHAFYNNTCVSGIWAYDVGSGCGSPIGRCAVFEAYEEELKKELWGPTGWNKEFLSDLRLSDGPNMNMIASAMDCDQKLGYAMKAESNTYFSPNGNATLQCAGSPILLSTAQEKFGIESNSTFSNLPAASEILKMATTWLQS